MRDEFGEFEYGKYDIKFYKDDNYTEEQKKEIEEHVAELLKGTGKTSIEDLTPLYMYFPPHIDEEYYKNADCPLCRACKNSVMTEENDWGEFDNCKAYGMAPDKYNNDCVDKDCRYFIPDKEKPDYQIIKYKLNLQDNG